MLIHERGKAQSRSIDLDDLTIRFGDISADRQAQPRPPSQMGLDYRSRDTTPDWDEEEIYRYNLKRETKYYNTLISEGGRPLYPFYNKNIKIVKRLQPEYDEAWKEFVDSQVLKSNETKKFICSIDSIFQHSNETERTEKAVKPAEATVTSAQNAITDLRRSNLSEKEAQRRLAAAQSRLDAAAKTLESIKRRNDLVYEFYKKTQLSQITKDGKRKRSYQMAREDADRRSILLRWILQQIPLIELELKQAKVAENDSDRANGKSCDGAAELSEEQSSEKQERKRSRQDDTVDDELPSKRPRYDGQRSSFSARKTPNTAERLPTRRSQKSGTTVSRGVRGRKLASGKPEPTTGEGCGVKSNWSTVNSSQPRKNYSSGVSNRRSARIAEREERLRATVVALSDTLKTPRQRTAKLTQAPTPPSSTELQERKLRSRAIMTSKRGRPRRGDKYYTSYPGILKRKG
ncbi:hypothetical protein BDZ45DRAFT_733970 [Acephala macrosclerotiorum]|nr:hypothetical protein BDZ45DRAFT_733970 [Acephala macrosclerotiorum]